MFPLFGLLTAVLCLLPRAETTNPYDDVLEGCTDLKEIAFKDWAYRALLFTIILKNAGYRNDLMYKCTREREVALWSQSEVKIHEGIILLDHTAQNRTDDYSFLVEAGKDIGEQLKIASQTQKKIETIGCEYDTKRIEVLCFAL